MCAGGFCACQTVAVEFRTSEAVSVSHVVISHTLATTINTINAHADDLPCSGVVVVTEFCKIILDTIIVRGIYN